MTERPQNVRIARSYGNGGGGYHSGRPIADGSRADDNQNRAYRGSHRAGGQHHHDHSTAAEQRDSRVGRHHADPYDDYVNR